MAEIYLELPATFGGYTLIEELGRGGAGVVFAARQNQLERPCAVKILHSRVGDSVHRERFIAEGRLTANLGRHPNIVQVFDAGFVGSMPYLAMELVEGKSLSVLVHEDGPLAESVALHIGRGVALALAHAHGNQVVHRDIKPGNIIIDTEGQPRVLDFGLARHLGHDDLDAAKIVGTPAFMAPEQADARFGGVDRRADIFALGATLYHVMSGQPPFPADSVRRTIQRLLLDPVPEIRSFGASSETSAVISKAMRKNPNNRYQTALEMADDLSRVSDGENPKSPQLSRGSRALGWIRRHQRLSFAITFASVTALALSTWFMAVSGEARRLWGSLSREMARSTAMEAREFLKPALPILGELRTLAHHGSLDVERPEELFAPLAARFIERPGFDWLGLGRADGEYIGMKRGKSGEALFHRSSANRAWLIEEKVAPETLARSPYRSGPSTYDPTKRDFYRAALKRDAAVWMEAYPFFETGEGWGITAVIPLRASTEAEVRGVFHVDFKLATLTRFMQQLEIGPDGYAFLLSAKEGPSGDRIMAQSEPRLSSQGRTITQSALAALSVPLDRIAPDQPQYVTFTVNDELFHGAFEAFDVSGGLRWYTLVSVPERSFGMSSVPLTYTLIAYALLLALIAAMAVTLRIRKRRLRTRHAEAQADLFASLRQRTSTATYSSHGADTLGPTTTLDKTGP